MPDAPGMVVVEVPAGLHAGQDMIVIAGDQEFTVRIPTGCRAGSLIEVALPDLQPEPEGAVGQQLKGDRT